MSDSGRWRLFRDEGRYLDRFGLVLLLSAMSVSMLSLVDLDDPTATSASEFGWLIVSFTVGFSLLIALRASGVTSRWLRIADIGIALTLVLAIGFVLAAQFTEPTGWLDLGRPSILWVVIAVLSPVVVLRRILSHKVITAQTVAGALAVYLLIAISFNYMFLEIQRFGSDPFFGVAESTTSFMYYSLVTITTVGYGDLAAVSDLGRFLSTAEAIIGQIFLVTIVARMVTAFTRPSKHDDA
jgi:hypothetical protein